MLEFFTNSLVSMEKNVCQTCYLPQILFLKNCIVKCDGLSQEKFDELAVTAKEKCPISRLYAGGTATIELDAKLA